MAMLSDKTLMLLDKCTQTCNAVAAAHSFLKDMLRPYGDDPSLTYRYEHSLRAAHWGMKIAGGEGWETEPLLIACLLHDVGYPECRTAEDFSLHQEISAQIAEVFLDRIGYDEAASKSICRAIRIHNLWNEVPDDAGAFELSVRDADDLDRFDALRTYMKGNSIVGNAFICDRSAEQVMAGCVEQLRRIEADSSHACATATAQRLWNEQLRQRRVYFENLMQQMKSTQDMEDFLLGFH